MWKQGQVTQKEYRDTIQMCKVVVMKAKTHLELHLARLQEVHQQQKEEQE